MGVSADSCCTRYNRFEAAKGVWIQYKPLLMLLWMHELAASTDSGLRLRSFGGYCGHGSRSGLPRSADTRSINRAIR
jgi:hypothetical protein